MPSGGPCLLEVHGAAVVGDVNVIELVSKDLREIRAILVSNILMCDVKKAS
jgi:hypothetical protein